MGHCVSFKFLSFLNKQTTQHILSCLAPTTNTTLFNDIFTISQQLFTPSSPPPMYARAQKRVLQALKQYVDSRIAGYPTTQQQDEEAAADPTMPW